MKYCHHCGTALNDSLNFCTNCGSKLAAAPKLTKSAPITPTPSPKTPSTIGQIIKKVVSTGIVLLVIGGAWLYHRNESTTYLTLTTESEHYPKRGGKTEVNIDYDGIMWDVTYKPSWVNISETSSGFTIKCQPNPSSKDREGHITVKSGKIISKISVSQSGQATFINLSERRITLPPEGGLIEITMATDGYKPRISFTPYDNGRINLSDTICTIEDIELNKFKLRVFRNYQGSRCGRVIVSQNGISSDIGVYQEGKCIMCDGSGRYEDPDVSGHEKKCITCDGRGVTL